MKRFVRKLKEEIKKDWKCSNCEFRGSLQEIEKHSCQNKKGQKKKQLKANIKKCI